jgi:hypothetical protein
MRLIVIQEQERTRHTSRFYAKIMHYSSRYYAKITYYTSEFYAKISLFGDL